MSVAEQHMLPLFAPPTRMVPAPAIVPLRSPPAGGGEEAGSSLSDDAFRAMGLRDYQVEACQAIWKELGEHRSTMLVLATGLGKTRTAACLIRAWLRAGRGNVLWLAHRSELLDQARAELEDLTGEHVSLEQAQFRGGGTRVIVGSVQTLKGARLKGWQSDRFTLIVTDEAHHAVGKSYRAIYDHFGAAKHLGLTATPKRHDGKAQGRVYNSVAYVRGISWGISEGYLVPLELEDGFIETIDLSKVQTVKGDLDQAAVEQEILKATAAIVHAAIKCAGDKRSLIFTPRVASAHAVAAGLNAVQAENARSVDGGTDKTIRRFILRGHKADSFQHLVNCAVYTEGYDDPGVQRGTIARPTKSLPLYEQILGRYLRPLPGVGQLPTREERLAAIAASSKPCAAIVDITGKNGKHRLISPVDILGGTYTDAERTRAKKLLRKTPGDVDTALRRARTELTQEELKRKEAQAKKAAAIGVTWRFDKRNPFAALGVHEEPGELHPDWFYNAMTTEQFDQLKEIGVTVQPGTNYGQANKLLSNARMRKQRGLASFKQIRFLNRYGIDGRRMYRSTASRLYEAISGNGFKALDPERVKEVVGRGREPGEDG